MRVEFKLRNVKSCNGCPLVFNESGERSPQCRITWECLERVVDRENGIYLFIKRPSWCISKHGE
jgi:hypothetical protein